VDQSRAPFAEDLIRRANLRRTSLHMPGHKHRGVATPRLRDHWGEVVLRSDLAEMSGVDYLEAPAGTLVEAQALAAEAFGASWSFFLVNGSSAGNQAALLSAARPGQKVIVPRTSHRSVFAGLLLAGVEPVYVMPEFHPLTGLPMAVPADAVAEAIAQHPDAVAVHLTSPSYYGACSDLAGIIVAAHLAGMAALVDEAHGAHFRFHPDLPQPALEARADLVVQSLHKTAGSLYQSSMLHGRDGRLASETVEHVLGLLQSSSPSSLLLASLDEARSTLATRGRELLGRCLELAESARQAINDIPGLHCYGEDLIGRGEGGVIAHDPTKLLIDVSGLGLTGYAAGAWLMEARGVEPEFTDDRHLLCSLTLADTAEDTGALVAAMTALAVERRGLAATPRPALDWSACPPAVVPLRVASSAPRRALPLAEALGEVCAEMVMLYPPGIPLLLPGERIEAGCIEFLRASLDQGATLAGVADPKLDTIRVVASPGAARQEEPA
jgi:arginine/lysine/ornithine decarboxylase